MRAEEGARDRLGLLDVERVERLGADRARRTPAIAEGVAALAAM